MSSCSWASTPATNKTHKARTAEPDEGRLSQCVKRNFRTVSLCFTRSRQNPSSCQQLSVAPSSKLRQRDSFSSWVAGGRYSKPRKMPLSWLVMSSATWAWEHFFARCLSWLSVSEQLCGWGLGGSGGGRGAGETMMSVVSSYYFQSDSSLPSWTNLTFSSWAAVKLSSWWLPAGRAGAGWWYFLPLSRLKTILGAGRLMGRRETACHKQFDVSGSLGGRNSWAKDHVPPRLPTRSRLLQWHESSPDLVGSNSVKVCCKSGLHWWTNAARLKLMTSSAARTPSFTYTNFNQHHASGKRVQSVLD